MRAALLQLSSSDDPAANLITVRGMMDTAADQGADLICTPEITNCVTANRAHQASVLRHEEDDPVLAGLRDHAARLGRWLAIGSLGIRTHDADGRFANRSFLIDPTGAIVARYDKIHMFDVTVSDSEIYRESAAYRPGDRAVVADTPFGRLGLAICYDLRFPHLHRALGRAGAEIILNPAAFTVPTGRAHWEVLLRARAIETGAFVLAAAQTGSHPRTVEAAERQTWGHSLAVAPWGEVLVDAGDAPGVSVVDLDLALVKDARRRIPALTHDRDFTGP
jgi:predicted amidohydrolase